MTWSPPPTKLKLRVELSFPSPIETAVTSWEKSTSHLHSRPCTSSCDACSGLLKPVWSFPHSILWGFSLCSVLHSSVCWHHSAVKIIFSRLPGNLRVKAPGLWILLIKGGTWERVLAKPELRSRRGWHNGSEDSRTSWKMTSFYLDGDRSPGFVVYWSQMESKNMCL